MPEIAVGQLTTLDAVKAKLDIPADDTELDSDIGRTLMATEDFLLTTLGYAVAPEERTDVFELVRRNQRLMLTKWPMLLTPTPKVEAKQYGTGSGDWEAVAFEVINPNHSLIVIEPPGSTWPPFVSEGTRFKQYTDWQWHLLRVSYACGRAADGAPPAIPPRLQELAAALTAYFYEQSRTGAVQQKTVGRLSEAYRESDVPEWARGLLASLERPPVTSWVA